MDRDLVSEMSADRLHRHICDMSESCDRGDVAAVRRLGNSTKRFTAGSQGVWGVVMSGGQNKRYLGFDTPAATYSEKSSKVKKVLAR
ncbi:MAG: hypothetical protein VYA84_05455 [Planctomycetota bacterium]|nr:hypothetical protein [Planctomycetota bacterium]